MRFGVFSVHLSYSQIVKWSWVIRSDSVNIWFKISQICMYIMLLFDAGRNKSCAAAKFIAGVICWYSFGSWWSCERFISCISTVFCASVSKEMMSMCSTVNHNAEIDGIAERMNYADKIKTVRMCGWDRKKVVDNCQKIKMMKNKNDAKWEGQPKWKMMNDAKWEGWME